MGGELFLLTFTLWSVGERTPRQQGVRLSVRGKRAELPANQYLGMVKQTGRWQKRPADLTAGNALLDKIVLWVGRGAIGKMRKRLTEGNRGEACGERRLLLSLASKAVNKGKPISPCQT